MRKYFTWRDMRLHVLATLAVAGCLAATWWQYHVAVGGNPLGWVYMVQWPFFAACAIYMWWKLLHDQSTLFDRMWLARQRAAADASGRPLNQIPGWAMDKTLSREVYKASIEAARAPALSQAQVSALESHDQKVAQQRRERPVTATGSSSAREESDRRDHAGSTIDAKVTQVKVSRDEEMEAYDAYNRFLADLAWRDPPKRLHFARRRSRHDPPLGPETEAPTPDAPGARPALASGCDGVRRDAGDFGDKNNSGTPRQE